MRVLRLFARRGIIRRSDPFQSIDAMTAQADASGGFSFLAAFTPLGGRGYARIFKRIRLPIQLA
jgi:hypothetical protein